jgi:predicted nucleic acid-binding protein
MYDRNDYGQAVGAREAGTREARKTLRGCEGGHSSIFAVKEFEASNITVKGIAEKPTTDFYSERSGTHTGGSRAMKVADSSYLIEALLREASLLENEVFVAPDLTLYEVINTLWKHQTLLKDLHNSTERIHLFHELITSEIIQLVRPDRKLLDEAYSLSLKHQQPIYDTIFIALALQLGLELKTFDSRQSKTLLKEKNLSRS